MLRHTLEEDLKPTPPRLDKLGAEPADNHLLGDGRNDHTRVLLHELAVKPNEVTKAADD